MEKVYITLAKSELKRIESSLEKLREALNVADANDAYSQVRIMQAISKLVRDAEDFKNFLKFMGET